MRASGPPFRGAAAIVTGGASGIGAALGRELAMQGAHVVLADVDQDAVDATTAAIGRRLRRSPHAGSVIGRHLDVRDAEAFAALVDAVAERHGALDLLCNNAGLVRPAAPTTTRG